MLTTDVSEVVPSISPATAEVKLTKEIMERISMDVSSFIASIFDDRLPFRVEAYDGSVAEPSVISPANGVTLKILRRAAITRVLTHPGELGWARAYVAGDIEVVGSLDPLLELSFPPLRNLLSRANFQSFISSFGISALVPLDPPPIEAKQRGRLHSRFRDRQAISHHYDISNDFYEIVLGPTMTYSCAVFATPGDSLEQAQERKVDLVARKLDLAPGMRLLDVGCGWGTMAIHAARTYGASVVGVTLSEAQQRYATAKAQRAGVADLVEFRLEDFRDVSDGPFDAISSIGMSEHVGRRSLPEYTEAMFSLLRPGGRFLNHAIGRPVSFDPEPNPSRSSELSRQMRVALGLRWPAKSDSPFIERYIFPDGELHEVGTLVSRFQAHGFEVRHVESLREHYVRTLRCWGDNLTQRFDEAVAEVGAPRARAWRLYMAGSAVNFQRHHIEIHQVLCVRPLQGDSGFPLRPTFEALR
jgi:cyclopropane-fatty-acyl-phospholipid synthase